MRPPILVLVALLLPACFEPDYALGNCELSCTDECPDGFRCDQGICVRPGSSADECTAELSITVRGPTRAYACEPLQLDFAADRAEGSLEWRLEPARGADDLPSSLSLDSATGRLSADPDTLSPNQQLDFRILVEDGHRGSGERLIELDVRDCVKVLTSGPSEPFCAGETVNIPLSAEGGSEKYDWSLVDVSDDLGLRIEDGAIQGTLADGSVGVHTLAVEARDETREDSNVALLKVNVIDCPRIEEPEVITVCSGDVVGQSIGVNGGSEPFSWDSEGLPDGLELNQGVLSGTPTALGQFSATVMVTDDAGERDAAVVELLIQACPELLTNNIDGCESVEIVQPIEARQPGDQLQWSVVNAEEIPSWVDFDTETGTLRGTPADPEQFELQLLVKLLDGGERAHSVHVAIYDRTSGACEIGFRAALPRLPDACVGSAYRYTLRANDGLAVDGWLPGPAWPDWLELDSTTGELSGTPQAAADHEFAIEVVGESKPQLALRVREQCNYGFIGETSGRERLFLGDSRQALGDASEPIEVSAPLADGAAVTAFEFSPDGQRIGFSTRDDGTDAAWIAEISDLAPPELASLPTEQGLREILDFSWSPNSAWVALLYLDDAAQQRLAIFDVQQPSAVAKDNIPVATFDPSGLFWLGSGICYIGESAGIGFYVPYCHELSAEGALDTAQQIGNAMSGQLFDDLELLQVLASENSINVFAATESTDTFIYYQFFKSGTFSEDMIHVYAPPDPSFTRLAQPGYGDQLLDQRVDVFELDAELIAAANKDEVTHGAVNACRRVDAWEEEGRALACSADAGLRIALLEGVQVEAQAAIEDSTDFPDLSLPKAFLPGAAWFVYDTAAGDLVAVNLQDEPWTARTLWTHSPTERVSLTTFAAQPSQLLAQVGAQLWLAQPEQDSVVQLGSDPLNEPFGCTGRFEVGGPLNWCGGQALPTQYAAFADASAVLFPSATVGEQTGNLVLMDIRATLAASSTGNATQSPTRVVVNDAFVDCHGDGCADELKLAPPRQRANDSSEAE